MKKFLIRALTLVLIAALIAAPAAFAVPETDDVQIQLNGEIMEFTYDTPPYFDGVAGKVYVPFRDLFEALGYEVGYESATRTVSATRIAEIITFNQDKSHEITVTRGDVTDTLTMDVPAITSDKGNMLVPVRFVSETVGANVGWDPYRNTVIIVETRSLFENDPTEYTIIEKVLKIKPNGGKNYKGRCVAHIDITESNSYGSATLPVDVTFDFITGSTGFSGNINVTVGYSKIIGVTNPRLSADYSTDGDIICNTESGLLAIRSSELISMLDLGLDDGAWLTMKLSGLTDAASSTDGELNAKAIMNAMYASILEAILYSDPLLSIYDFEDHMFRIDLLRGLLGDDDFVKSGNTFTNKMDLNDFGADVKCTLTVTTDNDGNAVNFAASFESTKYGKTTTYELSINLTEMVFDFSMAIEDYSLAIVMELQLAETTETTKTPQTQLPAGAKSVDINDIV